MGTAWLEMKIIQRTPCSIMAILSARRATESRCVMNSTVFTFGPPPSAPGPRAMESMVWNILFWACASRAEVYGSAVIIAQTLQQRTNGRTYRFIKKKEMNHWLVCSHECTSEGNTLPLKTWRRRVTSTLGKRLYCKVNAPRPPIDRGTPRTRGCHMHPSLLVSTTWNRARKHPTAC